MEGPDPSVQDWRSHLLNSLKGTGRLDTLKSQLRARLVDQLRDHDGTLLEFKGNRKPSITERILTSLFLDYLKANGFSFTQSVFLPESQSVSWPAFTFEEMSQLLHLDPKTSLRQYLKIGPREKGCLAQQLVIALQQVPFRTDTQDSSTQTSHQCSQDLDGCLREIDDHCFQSKAAESRMTFRTLEERLNTFRQEFEARVDAEVALQVSRIREHEIRAVRVEEEGRHRRQLAREREELEQLHKTRLERIREREESLKEQLSAKEKVIEASAYEERQKLLTSITDLRDREEKVTNKEDQQKKLQDALEERDKMLTMKEADIAQREATIRERAGMDAQIKIKEVEDKYRSCQEQLQTERSLLEAERAAYKEDKARLSKELAAVSSDRDLVHSLNERLTSDEKRRMELVSSLLERLTSEDEQRKLLYKKAENFHFQNAPKVESTAKSSFLDPRDPLQNERREDAIDFLEERSLGMGCKICQQQNRRWMRDQKRLQETVKQLERALEEAEDGKELADQARRAIQLQLKSSDSELLETVSLLKKTQHALELERLHHYSLRSQIASVFSLSSHDRFRHSDIITSLDPGYVLSNEAHLKTCCGTVPAMKDVGTAKSCEGDHVEHCCHNHEVSGQQYSNSKVPGSYQTKCKIRQPSPVDRPSSTRIDQAGTILTCQQEGVQASDNNSGANLVCTRKRLGIFGMNQSNLPCQHYCLTVVDGSGEKNIPFHKGTTEVGASPEFSPSSSGIDIRQISGKQIGSQTGRSHQDEQANSCCQQTVASPEASKVLAQVKSRASAQAADLETQRIASGDFQNASQSKTNYYVLESHSTKSSNSELQILVNQKTVKQSSSSGYLIEERVQTNIDIIETQSQQTMHGGRCKGFEACPIDPQKPSSSANSDCREACEEVNEVHASKMNSRTSITDSDSCIPVPCETGGFNMGELLRTKRTELETKRMHGDEALYRLSCPSNQEEIGPCTLDNKQHIPTQQNANDGELGEEKEVPTHNEPGAPLSNQAGSRDRINKRSCKSEPSRPTHPAETLLGDLRQWLTTKVRVESGIDDQVKSSEKQRQTNAESAPGNGELRTSSSRQSEDLESLTKKQRENAIQLVIELEAQHKQSKLSSASQPTSKISASESTDSLRRTGILGEGASSDESFSNPIQRTSSAKQTQGLSNSKQMGSKEPPYWAESQQDEHQNEDSGEGSRVQSEQGSYSPGEGTVKWMDDFPTAENSNYLGNSDEFSAPESDIYPLANPSSK